MWLFLKSCSTHLQIWMPTSSSKFAMLARTQLLYGVNPGGVYTGSLKNSGEVFSTFVSPAEPGDKANLMIKAIHDVPEFREMCFRRLRTLSDQLFVPGLLEGWYDQSLVGSQAVAVLDKAKWGIGGSTTSDRNSLVAALNLRRARIFGDARLPAAQTVAPAVVISELLTGAAGTTSQFVELFNPSTKSAVDVSGWKLTAFVTGRYTGSLPAAGTLTLARVDTTVADAVVYGGAGWPSPVVNQSLQVINLAASNDLVTNWLATLATLGAAGTPVPTNLVCVKTVSGVNAILTFSSLRGSSYEQLRKTPNTWVATVTGLANYTVVNGSAGTYYVRVKGVGFAAPSQDVPSN